MSMNKLGVISIVLGVIGFLSFFIASSLVGYIDERVENECNSEIGTIGQLTGLDEGECQNARDTSDILSGLTMPLIFVGTFFLVTGIIIIRNSN